MKIKKKNYTTVDGLLSHLTKDELSAVLNKTWHLLEDDKNLRTKSIQTLDKYGKPFIDFKDVKTDAIFNLRSVEAPVIIAKGVKTGMVTLSEAEVTGKIHITKAKYMFLIP